ncbi:hypothetical protein AK812_SmicGene39630 [Symbiodinium microadriaticum]|uniref:Uncharacterized protein n=1 Tax=Symbiodinium microadriaticum TaxID=2951 RepID=A0A1Q9CAS6_SYMMI|nr:hypothetical protein AK812_SmicGene39630 [Symbiodinium microadriaticum]
MRDVSQRPRSFKKFQLQVERTVDIVNFDHAVSLALLAMVCPKPLSLFQMQEHKVSGLNVADEADSSHPVKPSANHQPICTASASALTRAATAQAKLCHDTMALQALPTSASAAPEEEPAGTEQDWHEQPSSSSPPKYAASPCDQETLAAVAIFTHLTKASTERSWAGDFRGHLSREYQRQFAGEVPEANASDNPECGDTILVAIGWSLGFDSALRLTLAAEAMGIEAHLEKYKQNFKKGHLLVAMTVPPLRTTVELLDASCSLKPPRNGADHMRDFQRDGKRDARIALSAASLQQFRLPCSTHDLMAVDHAWDLSQVLARSFTMRPVRKSPVWDKISSESQRAEASWLLCDMPGSFRWTLV